MCFHVSGNSKNKNKSKYNRTESTTSSIGTGEEAIIYRYINDELF